MQTFKELAGPDALETLTLLPFTPGIKSDIDFESLLSAGESQVTFKGRKVKISIDPKILSAIKLKCDKFIELKKAHILNATTLTHVSQLGSVRGVPGAVGAASGVAAAVGTIMLNDDYSSYVDYLSTGLMSLISGGLATLTGYHLAGFLGEFKQRDLIKKMTKIADDNFEPGFLMDIKNMLLNNMKFELLN